MAIYNVILNLTFRTFDAGSLHKRSIVVLGDSHILGNSQFPHPEMWDPAVQSVGRVREYIKGLQPSIGDSPIFSAKGRTHICVPYYFEFLRSI